MCWVIFPRLLQDLSLSGEPHYIALVKRRNTSGELLVNRSDPSQSLEVVTTANKKPRSWQDSVLISARYQMMFRRD
ncbi:MULTISPECIES: hypothetical protein [unclassified Prochlorococcus]|uniref:hypothetical protein n=1 Tax=unclassified Prochlorococcus TaxID=2627481 RepID=UPI001267F5CD|nr:MULTISPECIES: hypothetical protein [unclassified Prochlorococcus]